MVKYWLWSVSIDKAQILDIHFSRVKNKVMLWRKKAKVFHKKFPWKMVLLLIPYRDINYILTVFLNSQSMMSHFKFIFLGQFFFCKIHALGRCFSWEGRVPSGQRKVKDGVSLNIDWYLMST